MIFRIYGQTSNIERENKLDNFFYTYKGLFVLIPMRELISRLTIRSIKYDKYHQIINYCYHAKIWLDYDKTLPSD